MKSNASGLMRALACLAVLVSLCTARSCWAVGEDQRDLMAARETLTRVVSVPGFGEAVFYSQNDPAWARLYYDNKDADKVRRFGVGGCQPTATAMALSTLVSRERLPLLTDISYRQRGYTMCTCSVNSYFCSRKHAQFTVETADEFYRYLPLVMANYVTGNNASAKRYRNSYETGGTSYRYVPDIFALFGLSVRRTLSGEEGVAALQMGQSAIILVSRYSPFSTNAHYMFAPYADQEYIYILDPSPPERYTKDYRHVIDVIEPGFVRVKLEDIPQIYIYHYEIIAPETGEEETP